MADPKNGSFRVCLGFADGGASGCGCDACVRVDREEEVSCGCSVGVVDGEGAASARERRSRRRRARDLFAVDVLERGRRGLRGLSEKERGAFCKMTAASLKSGRREYKV
jgi:hypothetical protein